MLWQPRGAVGLWTSSRQTIGYIQADLLAALMPSLDIHSDVKPHTHIEKKTKYTYFPCPVGGHSDSNPLEAYLQPHALLSPF